MQGGVDRLLQPPRPEGPLCLFQQLIFDDNGRPPGHGRKHTFGEYRYARDLG
jgi:hypothetical protein